MIKVVHIQKHLPASGNAALRLHKAMLEAGIDSSMLSLASDLSDDKRITSLNKSHQFISWIDGKLSQYLIKNTNKQYGLFSFPFLGSDISRRQQLMQADVIYLHWINGGLFNLFSIKKIAKLNKPIIFFMHDMWTFTGGCHYSFQCEKYLQECSSCQILQKDSQIDLAKIEFKRKARLFASFNNISFISPSKWLYDCAIQSELLKGKPIYFIPNIIDISFFKSIDKNVAKKIFNIDPDKTVISFGAASISSPYKGWAYLLKALNLLRTVENNKRILLLVFGGINNIPTNNDFPYETRFIGRLRDDYSTNLVYNASDVFLAPSLADNLPTTVMESLCCGTPVVGFNIGGIPDMIEHGKNGYLARYQDPEDMAEGIRYCLENKINGYLLPNFDPIKLISKHLDLIEQLTQ